MATKKKLKSSTAPAPEFKADATPGLVADPKKEGIPMFLQTQNRDKVFPINDAVKAKLEAAAAQSNKVRPFDQPKGETDEEYAARKNRERIDAENKKQREPKAPKPPKAEAPKGSFTLRALAREQNIDPRQARAVARANADFLKPLWAAGMKHTFLEGDKQRVLDVIKQGLDKKPVGTKKAKKAKAPKIPPAPVAVFTGKAKVKRTNTAPPTNVKGEKAQARDQIAAMTGKNKKKAAAKREADIDAKARETVPSKNEGVRAKAMAKAMEVKSVDDLAKDIGKRGAKAVVAGSKANNAPRVASKRKHK